MAQLDIAPIVAIAAVLALFINLSLFFFGRTKDFDQEYRSANNKCVSILVEGFKLNLDEWIKNNKKVKDEDVLVTLLPELEKLSESGKAISDWHSHMARGKKLLRSVSRDLMITGLLSAAGIGVLAYVDGGSQFLPVIGLLTFLFLYNSLVNIKAYCNITSEIEKMDSL